MKPINIAILWHQHQPVYNFQGDKNIDLSHKEEYILPWVRFHAIKDYIDLPLILHHYPSIKQTFNLVPSLLVQLKEYANNILTDKIFRYSLIPANELTHSEKEFILNSFFNCNVDNLIKPYQRYNYLFEKSKIEGITPEDFLNQEYLDLQVWYNLTWLGQISRLSPFAQRLFSKSSNFTEAEKKILLDYHLELCNSVIEQYNTLYQLKQIDISFSPFFHPILPLLFNSNSAKESLPNLELDKNLFQYPEDAKNQVIFASDYVTENIPSLKNQKLGMWCSEGSISQETLNLLIEQDIKWTATDETIYFNSLALAGKNANNIDKYFPKYYQKVDNTDPEKVISLFFRDHQLSDKIGFLYSTWNPEDAKNDFISSIHNIREEIINQKGEDALDTALITIILDGENCWEFYKNNGFDFLNLLYTSLSQSQLIRTVHFSEVATKVENNLHLYEKLDKVQAGSWIDGNFKIWIGDKEDQIAWGLLSQARHLFEEVRDKLSSKNQELAYKYLMIAEGSDWFWWFGDEHTAPNRSDFDLLFRYNLKKFYEVINSQLNSPEPKALNYFIMQVESLQELVYPLQDIFIEINGKDFKEKWKNAGCYNPNTELQSMHRTGRLLKFLHFAKDNHYLYFKIDLYHTLADNNKVIFNFSIIDEDGQTDKFTFDFSKTIVNIQGNNTIPNIKFSPTNQEEIEFSISRDLSNKKNLISLEIQTITEKDRFSYPANRSLTLEF